MDWSKSKTIFIVVFLIMNIFLYTQYLDVYTQGQHVEVLGDKTIEARLKEDDITYVTLPTDVENASYVSGKVRNFTPADLPTSDISTTSIINNHIIVTSFEKPVKLRDVEDVTSFTDFAQYYVFEGDQYVLWEVNQEQQYALFFQVINNRTLYYNTSGYLKIFWNDLDEIYEFEQTMLEKIEELEKKENASLPIQILQSLYAKNLLEPGSRIVSMNLGYSTLVQLTQTQLFAPTWEVQVRLADGSVQEHFVNAVDGKIIDIQSSVSDSTSE